MMKKGTRTRRGKILAIGSIGVFLAAFFYLGICLAGPGAVAFKSALVWRTDGAGDYLLSELAADGTYELIEAVETGSQIETLTANYKFKGKVTLEVSADNGAHYTPIVNGVPLTSGFIKGNNLKWRVTLSADSQLTEVRLAYTDSLGVVGTFGEPRLSGFSVRKPIVIARSDSEEAISEGDLFNYQVKIKVAESAGAASYDVHCDGNIQADFKDIRFSATDGETLLGHYLEKIEGEAPNRVATFYVKVPQIPAEGLRLYLYYGNSLAEDISSGNETFDFFDGFTEDALDLEKWELKQGTYTLSASQLKLDGAEVLSKDYLVKDGIIEYRARADAGNEIRLILRSEEEDVLESANQIAYSSSYEGAEHCIAVGDIVRANQAEAIASGETYDYRVILQGTNLTFQRYSQNYETLEAEVTYDDTGGLTSGSIGLKAGAGCASYFDWIRVRKYAEAEPYISASGDEEEVSLAQFLETTVAADGDLVLDSTEGAYSLSGRYTTAPLSTACNITAITPTIKRGLAPFSGAISIDISADGGTSWREGCESARTYSVPFDFTVGRELLLRANLSISSLRGAEGDEAISTPEIEELKLDYSIAPIVTSANTYCSGATGEGGVYILGDAIIVEWDNSATGDNNPDIVSVSCNFEPFGGDAQAKMYDDGPIGGHSDKEAGDNIYTVRYELPAGLRTTTNIYVTAGNKCGLTTRDGHILTVDTSREEEIEEKGPVLEEESLEEKEKAKEKRRALKRKEIGYEFLVRTKDKSTCERGDCITFKPIGWDWGYNERKHFAIIRMPNITYDEAKELCESAGEIGSPGYKFRRYRFNLDSAHIPKSKRNRWEREELEVESFEIPESIVESIIEEKIR